ncbi:hypothetical protein [Piscirickettsia litoralis]|nr:hypothetical protein [Piscirickettsia litoralis]
MVASFLSRITPLFKKSLRLTLINSGFVFSVILSSQAENNAQANSEPLYLYFHQQNNNQSQSTSSSAPLNQSQRKSSPVEVNMGVGANISASTSVQLGLNGLYNKNNKIENSKSLSDQENCEGRCLLLNGVSLSTQYKF